MTLAGDPALNLRTDNARPLRRAVAEPPVTWRRTPALTRAVVLVAVCLLLGVAFGRVDLVLIGAPFAIGTAVLLQRRPVKPPEARITAMDDESCAEGATAAASLVVVNPEPVAITTLVTAAADPWIALHTGKGDFAESLAPSSGRDMVVAGHARRWGGHHLGPVHVRSVACGGLLETTVQRLPGTTVWVLPVPDWFESAQSLPFAEGVTGVHRSRRGGDSGELAEVRLYQPGDRLRRIDWRTSMRSQDLYVNATLSERDTDVTLILDLQVEAGVSGGVMPIDGSQASPKYGSASIADLTVRAAGAVASHYALQGDRVSCVEFGARGRKMRPGAGRRHAAATLRWLASIDLPADPLPPSPEMMRRQLSGQRGLNVVFTPLLTDRALQLIASLARAGRPVLCVDTLPPGVAPPARTHWTPYADRLWRLGRENTVMELRDLGVAVEPWQGAASLDNVLAELNRRRYR
ncbi:DUF58 domain-containing protein [Glycomyces harbinensis]|uniref:Uncharacterized conserved protein, DUF58 family, contains vWF domain n=1 Tax=Glycomyces harbinensis TaxID=58114 RepID=A0A1G6USL3_9ACTN|nr:DUF58 domain-containing protein [Glycomyces harbinensis]SDD44234.1 Uncharacterized conserved protein, DUF58 family, contains vWF domain [Glycomyces harbinensis]